MKTYTLMHKDTPSGVLIFDEEQGKINSYKDLETGCSPFLGNANLGKIKKWWEMRSVPASRSLIQNLVKNSECINAETYLAKNLALSMTDCYWVNPIDSGLTYDMVKFSNLAPYNSGKIPYHNATSYDPNASLGGQMEKYWDLHQEKPVLVKEAYRHFGQQSLNEVFATELHKLQGTDIPFVEYTMSRTEDNGVLSKCNAFTSESVELISAYEVIESRPAQNDISTYQMYIDICKEQGIPAETIQRFMDYQTLTDFIISNTDEHLANFGILRNPDTMQIIGPAPIYDSGNSMFFSEGIKCRHTRESILTCEISSLYKTEERMIANVKDRRIVDIDKLPSKERVKEFYTAAGLPEEKADNIAHNYALKIELLDEFQHGKTISSYNEKHK